MRKKTVFECFWPRVSKSDGCWLWIGRIDRDGYGRVSVHGTSQFAHRVSYELHIGTIPAGLVIDHLCRNRACVNPRHLEAVTHKENMARGVKASQTSCKHGHPFTAQNTYHGPNGGRTCRACNCRHVRNYQRRKALEAA